MLANIKNQTTYGVEEQIGHLREALNMFVKAPAPTATPVPAEPTATPAPVQPTATPAPTANTGTNSNTATPGLQHRNYSNCKSFHDLHQRKNIHNNHC